MAYYPYSQKISDIYTLTSPTGVSAVFNDPTSLNYCGMLSEVSGLDSPDIRETADDLVQQDGGRHGDFWFSRRSVTLNGTIFNHASEQERGLLMDRINRASLALRGDATLSWKPANYAYNYVNNPSAEIDAGGSLSSTNYLTAGSTITRSTTQSSAGTASYQVVTTASGQGISIATQGLRANVSYTVTVKVKGNAGGEALDFYVGDSISGYYGSTTVNTVVTGAATTGWQTFTFVVTPTIHIPNAAVVVRRNTAATSTFFVDEVSVTPFYVEMYIPVRRQQPLRFSGGWVKTYQLQLVSEWAMMFSAAQQSVSGSPATVENRGSYPASPLFRVTGPTTNTSVVVTGGGTVFTTISLTSGQYVDIDTFAHTATRNDGTNLNSGINFGTTVNWPVLLTGNNTVTLNGGGTLTTLYRDTWV